MSDHVVTAYGAVGDGTTDDTGAVQRAIDGAHAAGGGRVVLPSGSVFRCGSVELRSRVELHLEAGSRLVAAGSIETFSRRFVVGALASGVSSGSTDAVAALLWAEDATDVAITGGGVVDGSARDYVLSETAAIYRMTNARPFPVFLIGCERVTVHDVTFVDAALWTLRLSDCHHVSISGIRIDNDMRVPNADGIDLDHCTRVHVVGCDIRCPDDGISLKTTDEFADRGPCEDIVISACTIQSRSTAITLGVDVEQPIRNVVVTGCVIRDSHRGVSVSIGSGAGGDVENVLFSDLVIETRHDDDDWWGCGEPIVVRSAPWHDAVGAVRRVRFRNILARSENGVLVYAGGGGAIEDIEISDLRLDLARWTPFEGHRFDLRPFDGAPAEGAYRPALLKHRPSAVHVEGATGVRLRGVQIVRDGSGEFGPVLTVRRSREVTWRGLATDERDPDELVLDGRPGRLALDGGSADTATPRGAAARAAARERPAQAGR